MPKKSKSKQNQKTKKQTALHTVSQRIDAVCNGAPYKMERLPMSSEEPQTLKAIMQYQDWHLFYQIKILPSSGDWLHSYPEEKRGQSFNAWYRYIKKIGILKTLSNANKSSIRLATCGSFNLYFSKAISIIRYFI